MATTQQMEALDRARSCRSEQNIMLVIESFNDRGIPRNEIQPGENVLTFHAWKALGRHVRKGESGVKLETWIPIHPKKNAPKPKPGETVKRPGVRRKVASVFHISQTDSDTECS